MAAMFLDMVAMITVGSSCFLKKIGCFLTISAQIVVTTYHNMVHLTGRRENYASKLPIQKKIELKIFQKSLVFCCETWTASFFGIFEFLEEISILLEVLRVVYDGLVQHILR